MSQHRPGDLPPDAVVITDPATLTRVWVSTAGCLLHLEVSPAALARGADVVAETVVALCRQGRR